MTPLLMGAGYAAGGYFFARSLTTRSWRSITLGFLPITAFTSLLLVATLLHWANFNHGHVAFWAWTFLYATTPVLVPALWLVNRRRDPGREAGELLIPTPGRAAADAIGLVVAALALALFATLSAVIENWPWQLTPLTARTVAAYLALTGATLLLIAWDARWRASKVLVESLLIGTALIVIAIIRAWDGLDPSQGVRWLYASSMVLGLVLLLAMYAGMESRRRRLPAMPPLHDAEQVVGVVGEHAGGDVDGGRRDAAVHTEQ